MLKSIFMCFTVESFTAKYSYRYFVILCFLTYTLKFILPSVYIRSVFSVLIVLLCCMRNNKRMMMMMMMMMMIT